MMRHLIHVGMAYLAVTILATVALCRSNNSQLFPTQALPTTTPEKRQIVVQHIYNYELRQYHPPVAVDAVSSPGKIAYASPESTVISHVSAMMAKDWAWFLEGWTRESANEIDQQNKKKGLDISSITARWDMLTGGKINFISRIDTGQYVIIVYEVQTSGGQMSRSFAPMKLEDGKWLLTNELRDDPLLTAGPDFNWTPDGRAVVTKIVR